MSVVRQPREGRHGLLGTFVSVGLAWPRHTVTLMDREVDAFATIAVPFFSVRQAILTDAGSVLGDLQRPRGPTAKSVTESLRMGGDDGTVVERDVMVAFGDPEDSGGHLVVPLGWRAIRFGHVFPSFQGHFWARGGEATTDIGLRGRCAIPFSGFGDGVKARGVARRAVAAELEAVVARLIADRLPGGEGFVARVTARDRPLTPDDLAQPP